MPGSGKPKRVAVITGSDDAHIPFVERHLREPLIIIDTRTLLDGAELSYKIVRGKTVVSYQDETLDTIAGVWYRKPQAIDPENIPVAKKFKAYTYDALERHRSLLPDAFADATWVSDYYAQLRAENKALQLSVARQVGFRVPDTIITSSEAVARAFIARHPVCVSKSLTNVFPKLNGQQQVLLTNLIHREQLPDLQNLYLAPSIFQEAIDAVHDVRVTVVGDQVFPAIMDSAVEKAGDHGHIRDNRLGKPRIEAMNSFPKDIADKCIAHVRALGLAFGAIDLLIDKRQTYWFLENNPNGQWAFIEEATGLPIGRSLAALLQGRS